MAKGYWVVRVDVTDPQAYKSYAAFVGPFLAANGGRFLIRGGQYTVPEGTARARTVVVEFASYAAAQAAYSSAEYEAGKAIRLPAGIVDFVIVEGLES